MSQLPLPYSGRSELAPPLGIVWNGSDSHPEVRICVPVGPAVTDVVFCEVHADGTETATPLLHRQGDVVWGFVPGVRPGDSYGIRVNGGGADPTKLLLDPYARAITGAVDWISQPAGHRLGSTVDTRPLSPHGVVVDERFDWGDDQRPQVPWGQTVLYEAHVKSVTKLHPDVPSSLRGTYAGIAHPAFVAHLQRLGVTSIELLPIHQHADEERLATLGLVNHWGYNTIGFFAPDHRYSASGSHGQQVSEFKGMVKLLHAAGIEVILDVVYNHTAEGGSGGAALSFRGLDPAGWYREPDVTGCGNTVDLRQPVALRLVLDSLRYWVNDCHIDGFRFDLAPALCRTDHGFSASSSFLAAVHADPVLNQVKLISEPWDIGMGGYQLGAFPAPWAEWNDRYRDDVRDLWRGHPGALRAAAGRIAGSSDLFGPRRRAPWASINFVAAHDGMTTHDLVTYNHKHNQANREDNRDGTDNNRSWNCGTEGPSSDPLIQTLRNRQQRNLLLTLLCSQGTPMLLAGDELGNTQNGNNNAYCQDNEISWLDWNAADEHLIAFTADAIRLRQDLRALRQTDWLQDGSDAIWLGDDAARMTAERWNDPATAGVTLILREGTEDPDVLLVINAREADHSFLLPAGNWEIRLSTASTPQAITPQAITPSPAERSSGERSEPEGSFGVSTERSSGERSEPEGSFGVSTERSSGERSEPEGSFGVSTERSSGERSEPEGSFGSTTGRVLNMIGRSIAVLTGRMG
jgi:isoamylase